MNDQEFLKYYKDMKSLDTKNKDYKNDLAIQQEQYNNFMSIPIVGPLIQTATDFGFGMLEYGARQFGGKKDVFGNKLGVLTDYDPDQFVAGPTTSQLKHNQKLVARNDSILNKADSVIRKDFKEKYISDKARNYNVNADNFSTQMYRK